MPVRVPRRLYSPTGKPRDAAVATHSREIRQMETSILRALQEQADAIQAAQDGVDGLNASAGGSGAIEYELVLSDVTAGALSAGTATLVDMDWTVGIGTGDSLTAGATGLVWDAGTTSTSYTESTQTSSYIELPYRTLWDFLEIDATWRMRIEAYFSSLTLPNVEIVAVGVRGESGTPSNSGARLAGMGRSRQVGVHVLNPRFGTTGVNYTTAPGPDCDTLGVILHGNDALAVAGEWGGSWAETQMVCAWNVGSTAQGDPMMDQNNVIFVSFATVNTGGDGAATLERIRIRAIPT